MVLLLRPVCRGIVCHALFLAVVLTLLVHSNHLPLLLSALGVLACAALWWTAMSGFDWFIHRFVLHGDGFLMPKWRKAHRSHHREFEGLETRTASGITSIKIRTKHMGSFWVPSGMIG